MNGKLKKCIGFSMLPFAFLFLFEPGYAVLDPLPDLFGYIILCFAIINLADLSPRIMEAFYGFRKGILISALRFLAIYLLKNLFLNREQTMGTLLFAFIFSFFELLTLIPAYKNLFDGLLSLGLTHNGNAVFQLKTRTYTITDPESGEKKTVTRERGKSLSERCYALTVALLVIRHGAMTLPEFTTLISNSSYEFIMLLRVFGILVALPIGIIWLIAMWRYCACVRADKPFIAELSELYTKKSADNPQYFTCREVTTGLYILLSAFVLSIDFYSDFVNQMPNFLFYGTLILAAIFLRDHSKKWKWVTIASSIGIITSVVSHTSAISFHKEYYPNAIRKNLEAYNAFYRMLAYHAVDAVVLIATAGLVLLLLWDVYKEHSDLFGNVHKTEKQSLTKQFTIYGALCMSSAILSGAALVYYVASQPFYYTGNWFFYYSTMISVAIKLLYAVGSAYFVAHIIAQIRFHYRLYL